MTFQATEGNGGPPIVMSKEPVYRPLIHRRTLAVGVDYIRAHHDDATVTFTVPGLANDKDCEVTYHRVNVSDEPCTRDMVTVTVFPETVVTWEYPPSN